MPKVIAYEEISNPRVQRQLPNGYLGWRTTFMKPSEDASADSPMAFLAESSAGRTIRSHFHMVDQFQVIYSGSGQLGTHKLAYPGVHFARAYTPYGPIRCGEEGIGFITLRAHRDSGANYMPDSRQMLDNVPNRKPWQITEMPDFNITPGENGMAMKEIPGMRDENGLAGYSLVMKPHARTDAPDPSMGDGQHIVVTRGSIVHDGALKKALAVVWVGKDEKPFQLIAGPEGCEAVVLNYPIPGGISGRPATAENSQTGFKTYQCVLCAFIYDEAQGLPEMGIAPGTRWADVPESVGCPDCEARKSDFQMIEI